MNEKKIIIRRDGRHEIRNHYGYKPNGLSSYRSVYGKNNRKVCYFE